MVGQVLQREEATQAVQALDDLTPEFTTVERLGSVVGNAAEGAGQVGIPEPVSGLGCLAVDEEGGGGPFVATKALYRAGPVLGDDG